MRGQLRRKQYGVSLLEIMIAIFITAIGVLGAAAMQLNALKYTDSSRLTSQASFIVYDVIDRMRANADPAILAGYELANIEAAPGTASDIRSTDLIDFANAVAQLPDGAGSIEVNEATVTVEVSWSEQRAGGQDENGAGRRGTVSVTTAVADVSPGVSP